MKTQNEIEDRIRYLLAEAIDEQVLVFTQRLPIRCRHNRQHPLDTRRQVHGESNSGYNRITVAAGEAVTQTIGLCMLGSDDPETWGGTICEDPIDAQKCPYFEPVRDKAAIWADFEKILRDPDQLRTQFPEIYGLVWALESTRDLSREIPWWKRLWFRMLRVRVEPARCQDSLIHLLPQNASPPPEE